MFAIIEIGGKQYLVSPGQKLSVEKVLSPDGKNFSIEKVLLLHDGQQAQIGQPLVPQAKVEARVVRQYRSHKVTVLKFKPKVRYRRKHGHRQDLTEIEITKVSQGE